MELGLEGKRALVTAASRGIGLAIAKTLHSEGACVAICGRGRAALEKAGSEIGEGALAFEADLTSAADVERLIDSASSGMGGIDILVSNTGGPPRADFAGLSDEEWGAAIDLTLMSAIRLTRAALPHFEKAGGGVVLFVTSVSIRQPVEGLVLSNAPRSGILGLSKTLANEYAPRKTRFNCLLPGFTWTDRVRLLAEDTAKAKGRSVEEIRRAWEADIPMKRMADPSEIAAVAAFMVSDRASYLTGTAIQVDGGYIRTT